MQWPLQEIFCTFSVLIRRYHLFNLWKTRQIFNRIENSMCGLLFPPNIRHLDRLCGLFSSCITLNLEQRMQISRVGVL